MDETAARALKNIVTQKGHQVLNDVRLLDALLQDYSPSTRRENMALMEALKDGVPRRFLALPSAGLSDATIAKLAESLAENTVLSTEAAQWAVRSWANALGLPVAQRKAPGDTKPGPVKAAPVQKATPGDALEAVIQKFAKEGEAFPVRTPPVLMVPPASEPQKVRVTFAQFAVGALVLLFIFAVSAIAGFAAAFALQFATCTYVISCANARNVPYILFGLVGLGVFRLVWSWLMSR